MHPSFDLTFPNVYRVVEGGPVHRVHALWDTCSLQLCHSLLMAEAALASDGTCPSRSDELTQVKTVAAY